MKGGCIMKRNAAKIFMITLVFCLSIVFVGGCAKKAVVKGEAAVTEEKPAAQPQAAAEVKSKDDDAARRRALKEQADREAAEKEAAMKRAAAAAAQPATYEFVDIYFDFDKYNLRAGDRDILKKHGEWLIKNGDYTVHVEGHCDERGTAEYNLALGERRAQEAKKYLIGLGVGDKRVSTVSYGKERPIDPGHTEEAWAKNRRDHFVVTRKK